MHGLSELEDMQQEEPSQQKLALMLGGMGM
jgi:hypothetical protein